MQSWSVLAIVSNLQVTRGLSHGNADTFLTFLTRALDFVATNTVCCDVVLNLSIPKILILINNI